MSLKQEIPILLEYINSKASYLSFNTDLFNVYEGELLKYIEVDLKEQLSPQSFAQAKFRIAPINIIQKLVDKLAKIYQQQPMRNTIDGNEYDSELLSWYEDKLKINHKMNVANEFFNLFNSTLIQPYIFNGKPRLRPIPNNKFLVYSDNEIDPTIPTHVIILHGKKQKQTGEVVILYRAYTDYEFIIFNSNGEIEINEMLKYDNVDGINVFNKIPFIYINKSSNLLIPKEDRDGFQMAKLLP